MSPPNKMGNGTSGQSSSAAPKEQPPSQATTIPDDYFHLKNLVQQLQSDLKDKGLRVDALTNETLNLRRQLKKRNDELNRYQNECHKLRVRA